MFHECFYLCKLVVKRFPLVPRMPRHLFIPPSVVQLRVSIALLDLEELGAGLGMGLFRLMLQEVAQHPGNGW